MAVYFAVLLGIAWVTGRLADAGGYFLGNRRSPWWVVTIGLIGDSLSGVTFISVPGAVAASRFSYLQIVLGYVVGYWVITGILLPLYYREGLTSIYHYLGHRFGLWSQRTGSFFFLLSRTLGAAARLYLAAGVLQTFVFGVWGVPFPLTVALILALILTYTVKGGIKTLVWTDLFQSLLLVGGVLLLIAAVVGRLGLVPGQWWQAIAESPYSQVFFFDDWRTSDRFFWKQFIGGALIAITMTGLDQNMMQKNLSCRTLGAAQRNLNWFSLIVVVVNGLFLILGALLYHLAADIDIAVPARSDDLLPLVALQHLGAFGALVFVIGLTAATFNSADSVLTTLTTSFYVDMLGHDPARGPDAPGERRLRHAIHGGFAVVLLLAILAFRWVGSGAVIQTVLVLANFTYGPLLGLFAYGLFTRRAVRDAVVPLVCVAAPLVCLALSAGSERWLSGYRFGNELLAVNGMLTAAGLWLSGMWRARRGMPLREAGTR